MKEAKPFQPPTSSKLEWNIDRKNKKEKIIAQL